MKKEVLIIKKSINSRKKSSIILSTIFVCNIALQGITAQKAFAMENDKFVTQKTITQISDKPNEEEFEIELKVNKKPGVKEPERKIDLEIAFDNSNSMSSANSNDRVFYDGKEAVKSMISGLDENLDRVALTPYKGSKRSYNGTPLPYSVDTKISLTNNFEAVKSEIDNMNPSGETPMYSGVKNAIADLKNNSRADSEKKLIIVSDGEPNVSKPIITASYEPIGYKEMYIEDGKIIGPTWETKYGKSLYEYRYAELADKTNDTYDGEFGEDTFFYVFDGDAYAIPDYRIRKEYMPFYEGGFDFLRQEVKDEVQKAKDYGIEVYVVYIQRCNTKDQRYSIDENLFKQTSIDFMKSLASSDNKFFTIDGLNSEGKLDDIFRQIKEEIKPDNHVITDEIMNQFSIVPNSFKAELDGIDKTSEIVPVEENNKLTWNFNDEARNQYELKIKYRIKRKIDTKGGTYVTSVKPAELSYNDKVGDVLTLQKLEFPETKVILKDFCVLTVKYLEKNTDRELASEVTTKGAVGIEYKTIAKKIENYKLVKTPDNATGKYFDGNIEVIYYYEKNEEIISDITTKSAVEINTETTTKGAAEINIEATTKASVEIKELPNKKQKSDSSRRSSSNDKGTLIVRYLDKSTGKELSESVINKDNIDAIYNVGLKNIDGYELLEIPNNNRGKYVNGTIEVIYYYGKKINPIEDKVPQGKIIIKEGNLIVKYLEKGTNKELSSEIVTKGVVGKDYMANSANISGYELIEVPTNEKGKYIDGTVEVIYYYGAKIEIPNDKLPQGKPNISENSARLPKTGENSKVPYYIIGALLIVAGLGMKRNFKTIK